MNAFAYRFFRTKAGRLLLIALLAFVASSCSTGGGGKKKPRGGGITTPTPTPSPTPDTDIDDDDVTEIETGDTGLLTSLSFTTSGNTLGGTAAGRQLSEYLLIVRASAKSCVRIKVAPNGIGEEDEDTDEGCTDGGEEESTSLTSSPSQPSVSKDLSLLDFGNVTRPAFSLVNDTYCSARLFRQKVDNVIRSKTGRLAYKHSLSVNGQTRYIRVWVDEEIANITCDSNGMLDLNRKAYAPLWPVGFSGYYDRFLHAHVEYLAKNTAEAYRKLADAYGDVSDVDGNAGLDIFVSPDVNRNHLFNQFHASPNDFEALPLFVPEDQAAYNALTNPTGNEGEILYMWAPDPAGNYKNFSYPSSVSLTTDYARGYMGFQIMNLLFTNQRKVLHNYTMESDWLREGLGLLASSYVGGNDYSFRYVANYLSSQPQILSLNKESTDGDFASFIGNERRGFLGMFAWYLHARLCGTSLEPCEELGDLIGSANVDEANVEAVTGIEFDALLENYGTSLGVALADDPEQAKAFWDSAPATYPEAPFDFPQAGFINAGTPAGNGMTTIVDLSTSATETSITVPLVTSQSISGPFTSRDMEIFQPIFPDYELKLDLAENSVTFIQIAGLLEEQTVARAFFGKHLNVVVVPLGELNAASVKGAGMRRTRIIHNEKVDENNFMNTSPINLTPSQVDFSDPLQAATNPNIADPDDQLDFRYPFTLNFEPVTYPDLVSTHEIELSKDKDLWIVGTIENGNISLSGSSTEVGDSDSYVVEANPCRGLAGGALTACQATDHTMIIQYYSRVFDTKTEPMFIVTANDTDLFRGQAVVRPVSATSDDIVESLGLNEDETGVLCELSDSFPLLGVSGRCANGGLLSKDGLNNHHYFFDNYNYRTTNVNYPSLSHSFAATVDNFLSAGPLRYPFTNAWNIARDETDAPIFRAHTLDFGTQEAYRSFYNFKYNADLSVTKMRFVGYTADLSNGHVDPTTIGSDVSITLVEDDISMLLYMKSYLAGVVVAGVDPGAPDDEFVGYCDTMDMPTGLCDAPWSNLATIDALILNWLNNANEVRVFYCLGTVVPCPELGNLNTDLGGPGGTLGDWGIPNAAVGGASGSTLYQTYYKPYIPEMRNGGCGVDPQNPLNQTKFCAVNAEEAFNIGGTDIREQFPVPQNEVKFCGFLDYCTLDSSFQMSIDYMSYHESVVDPGKKYAPVRQNVIGEVSPTIGGGMDARIGEVLAKTGIIHAMAIQVPGAGPLPDGGSMLNIIVGGKDLSEGKYLIRVRYKDFGVPLDPSELY